MKHIIYQANIIVDSNDPDEGSLNIPVFMNLTTFPILTINSDSLDFGEVFVNQTLIDTVQISNVGSNVVVVDSIRSNNPQIFVVENLEDSLYQEPFNIFPNQNVDLIVSYKPTLDNLDEGIITINSNSHLGNIDLIVQVSCMNQ